MQDYFGKVLETVSFIHEILKIKTDIQTILGYG